MLVNDDGKCACTHKLNVHASKEEDTQGCNDERERVRNTRMRTSTRGIEDEPETDLASKTLLSNVQ